jgi:hypothetical protein
MSHSWGKEHGRKLGWSFGKTEIDGPAWLLDNPDKSGNVRMKRKTG